VSLFSRVYDRLPRFGRFIALNVFGFRTRIRMRMWDRYIKELAYTEHLSPDEQLVFVEDRLRVILAHALKTVPRYHRFKYLLNEVHKGNVFAALNEFPVITRQEVLDNPDLFRSDDPGPGKIIKTVTSGTTGTPFTTWMHYKSFELSDAMSWRRNLWSGYRRGDWIARLVGDPIVPFSEHHPRKPWQISYTDKRLYLSTYHLNQETACAYLDILEKRQPAFIMGYPSALEILAAFSLDADRELAWRPRAVWFSSEPMFDHQFEIISKVFKAPILGYYGSAERILTAAQCEAGKYHISLFDGYMEGQFGVLQSRSPARLTSLVNRVMPLIRFELGDELTISDEVCSCGRTLPVIEPVITKYEDCILTPSGRLVSPSVLTWAFKDLEGVRKSQIVQVASDRVVVHVDVDESSISEISRVLIKRLNQMFFDEIRVDVVREPEIKLTSAGKTRFVVRKF